MPAGFVLGGIAAASTKRLNGHGVIWLIFAAGLTIFAVGFSRSFPLSATLLILSGVCFAVTNVFFFVVFQTRIPPELQGRAFGTLGTLSQGLRPVGLALTTSAIGLLGGVAGVFIACGLASAVAALGCYLVPGLPRLRQKPALEPSAEAVSAD